ncbi:MAG: UMP kinase [Salinivirgaceae bacterium]|nr:UMP kinase [Salinivirgaceae bacterium]MDD4746033.1 UMP kinase [Salinivirgaceae bacterium]MDY0279364.1 UMP kinase [Salinivirgaceae bacterium]
MKNYKRILLKLSGESLAGSDPQGINPEALMNFANQIKSIATMNVEIAIVIGGGNIFRGMQGVGKGFDRVTGDQMGMLATVINSLALQSALESIGTSCKVFTSIRMEPIAEFYSKQKAIKALSQKEIVIIAGGTGNPYFTTDSASALRAIELEVDGYFKATRVDGVYSADPEKDPTATKYDTLTYKEAISKNLKIMDMTAFALCSENNVPIIVYNGNDPENIKKILRGEKVGTTVK